MVKLGHIGTGQWGIRLLRMMNRFATVKSCYGHQNRNLIPKGVMMVESVDEIILDSNLDGVVIASPPQTHYSIAKKCLAEGHNIFVEKPMCLTVAEAEELLEIAHNTIMVGFVYLYSKEYNSIERGGVDNIKAYFLQTNLKGSTPLINLGSHFVALALDFYGEDPANVKVEGDRVKMEFRGRSAEVYTGRSRRQRREVIFLQDEKVRYRWNVLKLNYKLDDPLMSECRHFIECLETNCKPKTDGVLGLKTVRVVSS